jgi:hypothetical protein
MAMIDVIDYQINRSTIHYGFIGSRRTGFSAARFTGKLDSLDGFPFDHHGFLNPLTIGLL